MSMFSEFMGYETMKEQLKGEYREAFEAVVSYGAMKNVSSDVMTERMAELFDMLLTAQSEDREARRVVGEDRERFCKNIFRDYTGWDRMWDGVARYFGLVWIIFVLELAHLITVREGWREVRVSVLPYLLAIGCGMMAETFARLLVAPMLLKSRKIKPSKWKVISLFIHAFVYAGTLSLARKLPLPQWEAPSWWLALGAGVVLILFWIPYAVRIYKKGGISSDIRQQMRQDSYYQGLDDTRLETTYLKGWKKRYERLARKGKSNPEDFMRRMKKELRLTPIYEKGIWLLVAALTLPGIIQRIINGASDWVFYTLWMGICMILGTRFIVKQYRKSWAVLKQAIESCEASGLSLPEYIEEKLSASE